jgi:hypothetical protein
MIQDPLQICYTSTRSDIVYLAKQHQSPGGFKPAMPLPNEWPNECFGLGLDHPFTPRPPPPGVPPPPPATPGGPPALSRNNPTHEPPHT